MALQHTITVSGTSTIKTEGGVVVLGDRSEALANAYIKVEAVNASKDTASASVSISGSTGSKIVKKYTFTPSVAPGSENFIKQAYEHIKTLPEFAGAADV